MRGAPLALTGVIAWLAACGPASFPDTPAVVAAQAKWCDALAKASGADKGWEHMSRCKAAMPTGSAAFVRGMAKCFPEHKAAGGEKSIDVGLIVAECRDDVLLKMQIDEAVAKMGIDARCDRAVRCEKATKDECVATAAKVDASQRATLYGMYNGAAFDKIADCLRSSPCNDDENIGQSACYKAVESKLIWFP